MDGCNNSNFASSLDVLFIFFLHLNDGNIKVYFPWFWMYNLFKSQNYSARFACTSLWILGCKFSMCPTCKLQSYLNFFFVWCNFSSCGCNYLDFRCNYFWVHLCNFYGPKDGKGPVKKISDQNRWQRGRRDKDMGKHYWTVLSKAYWVCFLFWDMSLSGLAIFGNKCVRTQRAPSKTIRCYSTV
jgi:hypothetical protein